MVAERGLEDEKDCPAWSEKGAETPVKNLLLVNFFNREIEYDSWFIFFFLKVLIHQNIINPDFFNKFIPFSLNSVFEEIFR